MRPFLARLIERAQGTAQRIEPLIAPQFAPADSLGAAAMVGPTNESELHPSTPPATRPTHTSTNAREATQPEQQSSVASKPGAATQIINERLLVPHFIEREQATTSVAQSPGIGTTAQPHSIQPSASAVVRESKSSIVLRETARALLQPPSAQVMAMQPDAETPPTVRVTIGRIEVRAVQPAAPSARKPPPKPTPSLTLDAYLDSRRKGAR